MARRREVSTYRENPFLKEAEIPMRNKRVSVNSNKEIVDTVTGEITAVAEVVEVHTVDSEQFIKIYSAKLSSIFSLTPVASKIARVLFWQVQTNAKDSDRVMLNFALAVEYFGKMQESVSRASFTRGIKELIEKNFIAEHEISGFFFINPHMFFNGDRARFVTEIRKERGAKTGAEELKRLQKTIQENSLTIRNDPRQIDFVDEMSKHNITEEEIREELRRTAEKHGSREGKPVQPLNRRPFAPKNKD